MTLQPIETIVESYVANIAYEANASVSQAQAFLAACLEIKVRRPKSVTIGGDVVVLESIDQEIAAVRKWLSTFVPQPSQSSQIGATASRYYDTSNIRGY